MVQAGSSDMISFLRDMPHLKAIELKRSLDQDLEMAILQRRNLTVLHINDATELHYALPDVVANPTSTFSLRELKIDDIVTPRKTYRLLLSRLPSLEVFELGLTSSSTTTGHIGEVVDITQDLLNPLLNCTGLRKLKIHDEYGDSEH